ncbi:hypothetical protein Cgig2_031011 [Carnegiea gigantea]|uniref:Transmembrane protein n=1 Tax=Carnegiea gigantea TaxID=171969 RepID=A0A9Q1KH22_9CARY|nr:hypothetical protein Cgig2_031011 [Carnegiea gigantea]
MTPYFSPLLLSLLLLSLFVNTRPCKTFLISTYSFSLLPQIPNPNLLRRPEFIVVVVEGPEEEFLRLRERPQLSLAKEEFGSFRDRTKDILSVVASLLFGAACGALIAGTMYLAWSLFNHCNEESYRSLDGFSSDDDDENDDDEENIFNPKKKGYVAIPSAPATP